MQTLLQRLQQTEHQANERIRDIERQQVNQREQFQQTTDQIHQQYRTALADQQNQLEQRVNGAAPTLLEMLQRMAPNTFRRFTSGQFNKAFGAVVREQAAANNTGAPQARPGPRVVTIEDDDASSMTGLTAGDQGGAGAAQCLFQCIGSKNKLRWMAQWTRQMTTDEAHG